VKIAAALLAIAVALALQTTLGSLVIRGTAALDLVLIVVVYLSLISGPVSGVLIGSAAGLVQDALSSGIIGIGGLAKTIVGFVAGFLGTQFILTAPLSRFLVFVISTLIHAVVFMGLYTLLEVRRFDDPLGPVVSQALGNGFLGVLGAQLVDWLPGLRDRRKTRYTGKGRPV
jgi:rod shape-determining protein MreD